MATINAAATKLSGVRGTIVALAAALMAGGLAGCAGNGESLLASGESGQLAESGQATQQATRGRIAIAPVIGAPDTIAKQIVGELTKELGKGSVAVAQSSGEQVDYTLRGYIVAARETTGTKVSYIWDVTNPTGARAHRITGEEVVNGAGPGDPWASVSADMVSVIAAKTGQQLIAWMPAKAAAPQPVAAQTPVAAAKPQQAPASNSQVASVNDAAARSSLQPRPSATQTARQATSTSTTTGSISRSNLVAALVPQVAGAPGDGSSSLANALRAELMRNGVGPAAGGASSYRVVGRVKMGKASGGQQPIKIDWVVKDPQGRDLGTVSQENQIPAGSLDGAWGSTANAAATAAAQGILKLLPNRTATR